MRVDLGFGASLQPDTFEAMLRRAILMDKLGFDHVWVPDHLVFLGWGSICLDAWCVLSGFAVETERIRLGTSVSDPYRRHPAVFAQTIGTLDQLSNGRAILGLGLGEAQNLIPYGIPYDRRVARLGETVEVMKRLWTGGIVDFSGEFYSLKRAFIQAVPVQKPHPPVFVAANSPRTREMAGMVGDGWMAEMMTPERYREDLRDVQRGAEKAGRRLDSGFRIAYHGPLSIAESREEAWKLIEKLAKGLFLWWPKQLEVYGYKATQEFDWRYLLVEEDTARRIEEHLGEVPEEVARGITVYGTPDDCIERIEDYVEAGVTDFAFFMEFQDKSKAEEVFRIMGEKIIPYFREA